MNERIEEGVARPALPGGLPGEGRQAPRKKRHSSMRAVRLAVIDAARAPDRMDDSLTDHHRAARSAEQLSADSSAIHHWCSKRWDASGPWRRSAQRGKLVSANKLLSALVGSKHGREAEHVGWRKRGSPVPASHTRDEELDDVDPIRPACRRQDDRGPGSQQRRSSFPSSEMWAWRLRVAHLNGSTGRQRPTGVATGSRRAARSRGPFGSAGDRAQRSPDG